MPDPERTEKKTSGAVVASLTNGSCVPPEEHRRAAGEHWRGEVARGVRARGPSPLSVWRREEDGEGIERERVGVGAG